MRSLLLLFLAAVAAVHLHGQSPGERSPIRFLRFAEDYGFLADTSLRSEPYDALKYIGLGADTARYLTLGSDLRYLYERRSNPSGLDQNWHLLRVMVHADLHWGERFRLFVQPAASPKLGGNGVLRPIDEDELFVLNAFADIRLVPHASRPLDLRVGRFEMNYGAGRFVTLREGPNVRHSWEGGRLRLGTARRFVDAFYTQYIVNQPGIFDNPILDDQQRLWGVYTSTPLGETKLAVDAYYFGIDLEQRAFFKVAGEESRHTLGTRISGNADAWDLDAEVATQFGETAEQSIRAFGFGSSTGYTLSLPSKQTLRLGLKLDYWSGDADSTDRRNNTFNPLYPRQGYYRGAAALWPSNFVDLHPELTYRPTPQWQAVASASWYWRARLEEGFYIGGAGVPGLPPLPGAGRYLGAQLDGTLTYRPGRHAYATLVYSHFRPGAFVGANPRPREARHFLNLVLAYRI